MKPLKADHCPLCGALNECAVSACGRFDADCWCAHLAIDPAVLARVPDPLKGRACLCRNCATGVDTPPLERP